MANKISWKLVVIDPLNSNIALGRVAYLRDDGYDAGQAAFYGCDDWFERGTYITRIVQTDVDGWAVEVESNDTDEQDEPMCIKVRVEKLVTETARVRELAPPLAIAVAY